jgi:hypothetical protein
VVGGLVVILGVDVHHLVLHVADAARDEDVVEHLRAPLNT